MILNYYNIFLKLNFKNRGIKITFFEIKVKEKYD